MVRQPATADSCCNARQAARNSSRSICGTIFLVPKYVVNFVLHLGPRLASREADSKCDDGRTVQRKVHFCLFRVQCIQKEQAALGMLWNRFVTESRIARIDGPFGSSGSLSPRRRAGSLCHAFFERLSAAIQAVSSKSIPSSRVESSRLIE